ncbi:MAG: nucleoside 2-deoxyribosyltransferase [Janthinobacterium lividum]
MTKRVYLAGPDVFLPDAPQRGERLKRLCGRHGLAGVFPLDPLPGEPAEWAALPLARAIARRNEAHIRSCCALVANLTPFRGPGADGGTAYELGFARALGLPVFGWSNGAGSYLDRCARWPGAVRVGAAWRDPDGLEVESFGLPDNLMMACAVTESGTAVVAGEPGAAWDDLDAFERCVALAARSLGATP